MNSKKMLICTLIAMQGFSLLKANDLERQNYTWAWTGLGALSAAAGVCCVAQISRDNKTVSAYELKGLQITSVTQQQADIARARRGLLGWIATGCTFATGYALSQAQQNG